MPELKIAFVLSKGELVTDTSRKNLARDFRNAARMIESDENIKFGNIEVAFVSAAEIKEMNNQYLSHDYETDILTFDLSEGEDTEGQLFISPEVVKENAGRFRQNPERELMRVMIHGLLHLAGYDDRSEKPARKMRRKENEYLTKLRDAGKSN